MTPIIAPIWTRGPSLPTQRIETTAKTTPNTFTTRVEISVAPYTLTPFNMPITSGTPDPAAYGPM